jgi:hypothetical protein
MRETRLGRNHKVDNKIEETEGRTMEKIEQTDKQI